MFKQVVICGMGVMGASLAKALNREGIAKKVYGWVRRPQIISQLKELNLIDFGSVSPEEVIPGSDLIILATPVEIITKQMEEIKPFVSPGSIITDIGSVKASIVSEGERIFLNRAHFVGSHPMTGTEKSGFEYLEDDLYSDAPCVVTSTSKTDPDSVKRVIELWKVLGCNTFSLSPEEHDCSVALISHLPHLISFAFYQQVMDARKAINYQIQGGSFKDLTRIAGSSARIWTDIFKHNQNALIKKVEEFESSLDKFKALLQKGDYESLFQLIQNISSKKGSERDDYPLGK